MTLAQLTSNDAVNQAIEEFDRIGRDAFLAKYGFGRSTRYFIQVDDRLYDSKAIVGAAHGYQHTELGPLAHQDFSGGDQTVRPHLEHLGFLVVDRGAKTEPFDVAAFARRVLGDGAAERVEVRAAGETQARALLDRNVGSMSVDDFDELFGYFNTDRHDDGRTVKTRFKPAFMGATRNRLIKAPEELNAWTRRIWAAPTDEAALDEIDRLFSGEENLNGAGTSYPSMLMYLRDPTTWAVWTSATDRGLRELTTDVVHRKPNQGRKEDYRAFSARATELSETAGIAPQEIDFVLAAAAHLTSPQTSEVEVERPRRAWVFQANPSYYAIDRAVDELDQIEWTVRQYYRQVAAGDLAYLWRSGAQAGIVAVGTVMDDPIDREPDRAEDAYYLRRDEFAKSERRVNIRVDRKVDPMLLRSDLLQDESLHDLEILRFQNATVFKVSEAHDLRLRELLDGADRSPRFWWVNQGSSLIEEQAGGYIWAPLLDKGGRRPEHWRALDDVKPGDTILHYKDSKIRAVGTVTADPVPAVRPHASDDDAWQPDGIRVDVTYHEVSPTITLAEIPVESRVKEGGPFTRDGGVRQGYLFPLGRAFIEDVAQRFPQLGFTPTAPSNPPDDYTEPSLAAIIAAIADEGLVLSDAMIRRYHLSLKTRGFVVLAGVSGTGKTWLADAYATAVGAERLIVPVAPNWTTNEDLLGYLNPLDDLYRDTEFSRFLRHAALAYESATASGVTPRPFHLILDEMNLARVEYYFAKFLSAMEVRARDAGATIELAPGESVTLPPNLKFVGTVNVDETTHGFADKVYDRSQLLELTIDRDAVRTRLNSRPYQDVLAEIWVLFADTAPFAFRVLDEIAVYTDHATALDVEWQQALDEQLLQKVLPKLKGTDPRIGAALDRFLEISLDRFPLSHAKASTMKLTLDGHNFTSYF